MMASSLAITGAMFTFLSLATGALWGKPTWGTWWVWDARMTSTLILMFLYIGFISLQAAIDDPRRADRAGAVLALVGVINVPIIYFSVQWWNTLHQSDELDVAGQTHNGAPNGGGHADYACCLLAVFNCSGFDQVAMHHTRARRGGGSVGGGCTTAPSFLSLPWNKRASADPRAPGRQN